MSIHIAALQGSILSPNSRIVQDETTCRSGWRIPWFTAELRGAAEELPAAARSASVSSPWSSIPALPTSSAFSRFSPDISWRQRCRRINMLAGVSNHRRENGACTFCQRVACMLCRTRACRRPRVPQRIALVLRHALRGGVALMISHDES
jgi:hypothetical protein